MNIPPTAQHMTKKLLTQSFTINNIITKHPNPNLNLKKKNPEIIKKNRHLKQEGWRIADFFSHHPEAMHIATDGDAVLCAEVDDQNFYCI